MSNVLLITNKNDLTTDYIVRKLTNRSIQFYRLNTEEITKTISIHLDFNSNQFWLYDKKLKSTYNILEFTGVYYRRPELPILKTNLLSSGEINFMKDEIIYTLEGLYKLLRKAKWISPIYSIREAENKIYQIDLAKKVGFKLPPTVFSSTFSYAKEFFLTQRRSCIVKPIKSGLIEDRDRTKVIFTNQLVHFPKNRNSIERCPVCIQGLIEKDYDLRVTVVGNKIFAVKILSQTGEDSKIDWRKSKNPLQHKKIKLPLGIESKCLRLLKILKLQFGAIDLIKDVKGSYYFLEINPNGQWAWIENQTGYRISDEIVKLLLK